jgi:hypothetical protein
MKIDLQKYWAVNKIHFSANLVSRIVDSMQKDGTVDLVTKEPVDAHSIGLFNLLDQICDYWKWDKKCFKLHLRNYWDNPHTQYQIVPNYSASPYIDICRSFLKYYPSEWNHEKNYGMFIGRINVTRLRGIYRHTVSPYAELGLVSWHQDIQEYIDRDFLLEYLIQSGQTYGEISSIRPYSNIGTLCKGVITNDTQGNVDWTDVYNKIGIELVFETAEKTGITSFSEKILRPMYFKRPFILIGSQGLVDKIENHVMQYIKKYDDSLELRFFKNIIPKDFDQYSGIHRTDYAFDILENLIRTERINQICNQCREDIEINYNTVKKIAKLKQTDSIYDFKDWARPNLKDFNEE